MTAEVTTVGYDEATIHLPSGGAGPARVMHFAGLAPDADHVLDGVEVRTLPRPPGELLAVVATVNDTHFGETEAGRIDGTDIGPVLSSPPGAEPYPEVMNRAAAADILAARPDLVVAKGDLTAEGRPEQLAAFNACYAGLGDRLVAVVGNHDVARGRPAPEGPLARALPFAVHLEGVTVAVVDTTVTRRAGGAVGPETLEWLDAVGADADRPVLVMGHHHPWAPGSRVRPADYFGINPDDSEALVAVFARRPRLAGYFAGHTHRNRVRRFPQAGGRPWVEVASVKEFPGVWAEYRVHEGGIVQVVHRVSDPAALEWAEATRALYGGTYTDYAFGRLEDRCFTVTTGSA